MNLKKFAGVDSYYRDIRTGNEIEFREYMARIVNKIGIDKIEPYIPFEISDVKEMLKYDAHLNNLPLRKWDYAASYMDNLLARNGITAFSQSEKVCILKEAARILAERER